MAAPKVTGLVEVLVNGVVQLNKEGAKASGIGISGEPPTEREPVLGDTGYHGQVETPQAAMLEVTVTDRDDVSLSDICAIKDDGTIIFRARGGGKSYTMANATCANNLDLTAGKGEVTLKFFGPQWEETTQ